MQVKPRELNGDPTVRSNSRIQNSAEGVCFEG
jgi:hypothetical protein